MCVSNPRPSEALNWVVRDAERQRELRDVIFDGLLSIDPDVSFYIHFDEVTGMLMMPEFAGDDGYSDVTAESWENTRRALEVLASDLAGRDVRSFVKDDRFYRFRFRQFNDGHWKRFHEALAALPGWMHSPPGDDLARWFGINESFPPFAWASVEDFGFEVFGVLLHEQWEEWHREFLTLSTGLPAMTSSILDVIGDR